MARGGTSSSEDAQKAEVADTETSEPTEEELPETPESSEEGLSEASLEYFEELEMGFNPVYYTELNYEELLSSTSDDLILLHGYIAESGEEGDDTYGTFSFAVDGHPSDLAIVGYLYDSIPDNLYIGDSVSLYAAVLGTDSSGYPNLFAVKIEPLESSVGSDEIDVADPNNPLPVEIKDATFTSNYDGERVAIVNIEFTNNSDSTATFWTEYEVTAFQNGVALDDWYIGDDYDSSTRQRDVKPGSSLVVQKAFVLDNESEITVEVTKFWTDEIVATGTINP